MLTFTGTFSGSPLPL